MKILGVRSFSNKGTGQTIQFDAPLTLIVGYNGSGKTTIIECLKFATTGILPPNAKNNGAFVHDPKLAAEKEVMAQVKLQYKNATGHKMVLTRSMSVSVTKTKVKQTTLECQLLMSNHGERTSMSTRAKELVKIVPESLGVSPSILDAVIFCHQDESLWPMSEPAALKKRFDTIFEAQAYTKAVETLKLLRKGKMESLKLLELEEIHSKSLKDKSEKVKKRMTDLDAEIEVVREQVKKLDVQMDAAAEDRRRTIERANEALGIRNELNAKYERARNLEETLETLGTNMTELKDSDEWLELTLAKYEQRMAEYQEQEDEYKAQYTKLQQAIKTLGAQLSAKQAEKGRHQAAKDTYDANVATRAELVREAARSHSMRGYDDDLDDEQIQDFVQRIQKLSHEKDRELERIQKAAQDEIGHIQETLDALSARRTTRTQEKINARQAMDSNAQKSRAKQHDLERIKMDEGTKVALETSLKDLQTRLEKLTTEYEAAGWDASLKNEKTNLMECNIEGQRLKNELVQSNKLASERAQVDVHIKNAKKAREALETMRVTYDGQFTTLIGPDWQPDTLERDFQIVVDKRIRELEEARKQQQGLVDEVKEINSKLKAHRANLAKKKDERQKCQAVVMDSIVTNDGTPLASVDEFPIELEDLKGEYEDLQREIDGEGYVTDYYKSSLKTINDHNTCRLCRRTFANANEKTSAISRINSEIAKFAKDTMAARMKETKEALKKADDARTQYDMYNTLSKVDIPYIEKEIKKLEEEKSPKDRQLEERDIEVSEKETAKRDAELFRQNVNKIVGYTTEAAKNDEDAARLSSQQKLSGSSMSIDEIDEQISANDERIRVMNSKITKLANEKEIARNKINNLERDVSNLLSKFKSAEYEMEKKGSLLATIEELRANTSQQREIMQQADSELEALIPQVSQAEAQREDAKQRGQAKEKDVRVDKEKLAGTVNRFKLIEASISNYIDSGGPSKLKSSDRAIKELEQTRKEADDEILTITTEANDIKKLLHDSETTKRNMKDNITYRKARSQLEIADKEIKALEGRQVDDNYDELAREAKAAANRYDIVTNARSNAHGTLSTKDKELERFSEEYQQEYGDAGKKYRESHILVKTNQAASEDLATFIKALDQAIMQYHTIKMQEINAIAGELWRSTYQGTDVDTIMIRSNASENSKRNYDYRVVMVKQDAEMDMRGRCSAGQKVLASIIIRLALAECFGINCGVIALDEPTTNLDRDNIKSLAESLNSIIKSRRHQPNFQLIIITHDEEFLKDMKCSEFTDNYYRVSRDADQKSIIERQSLADFV